jgi:hypothetical protein
VKLNIAKKKAQWFGKEFNNTGKQFLWVAGIFVMITVFLMTLSMVMMVFINIWILGYPNLISLIPIGVLWLFFLIIGIYTLMKGR